VALPPELQLLLAIENPIAYLARGGMSVLTACIHMNTVDPVYNIRRTEIFDMWLSGLKDTQGQAKIIARLDSMRLGNLGDAKLLGGGLRELRIHSGPGYKLCFIRQGVAVIVLLCGGDKSSQNRDISRARMIMSGLN